MTDLRVATFNIRNGRAFDGWNSWPFRRKTTAATIAALDADVLGLQEVFAFQLRWLHRRLPAYDVNGRGRGSRRIFKGEHSPVPTRRSKIRVVKHWTRWYGDQPDVPGSKLPGARFPRIATGCVLEIVGSGERVQLVNTHLDAHRADLRARSAEQLVTWLDPSLPQIVVGDFNAEVDSPPVQIIAAAGLRSALPADACGTNHDFTGRLDGKRIDHVLVSEHFEVTSAEVWHERIGGRLPSDHWPVVTQLQLR